MNRKDFLARLASAMAGGLLAKEARAEPDPFPVAADAPSLRWVVHHLDEVNRQVLLIGGGGGTNTGGGGAGGSGRVDLRYRVT